jgi:hypothetical protein
MGRGGSKEVKRLALTIRGIKSNDLLMTKTSIAVNTIYATDRLKLKAALGYW